MDKIGTSSCDKARVREVRDAPSGQRAYGLFAEHAVNLFVRLKRDKDGFGRGDATAAKSTTVLAGFLMNKSSWRETAYEQARQSFRVISAFLSFCPRSPSTPFS